MLRCRHLLAQVVQVEQVREGRGDAGLIEEFFISGRASELELEVERSVRESEEGKREKRKKGLDRRGAIPAASSFHFALFSTRAHRACQQLFIDARVAPRHRILEKWQPCKGQKTERE